MPTTNAGIYELILNQQYNNEIIKNVFHYRHTLGEDDHQALCAQAFDEDVLANIQTLQNTQVTYDDIRVKNLTGNLADAIRVSTIPGGSIVGTPMAEFLCCPFRYNRVTKDTRNGAKRFSGMVEENTVAGDFTGAYLTIMQTTAAILEAEISTVGGVFEPIILRQLPDEFGVYTYNTVANVTALDRQTTQNSRKTF